MSSINTKYNLANALKHLILEMPISDIKVADIVSYCDINRKTFYYHFHDIEDLFTWMMDHEAEYIQKEVARPTAEYKDPIFFVINYILKNRTIFLNICTNLGKNTTKAFLHNIFYNSIYSYINTQASNKDLAFSEDYKLFLAHFYAEGLSVSLIDECYVNDDIDCDKLLFYFQITIKNALLFILSRGDPTLYA